jgi:myo-inositol-1(or 4)-monophosphatase
MAGSAPGDGRVVVGAGEAGDPRLAADVDAAELLSLAVEAAHASGRLLRERFSSGDERQVRAKTTPTDLVSEADLESQRGIRGLLLARRPHDGFLGEEEGVDTSERGSGLRWVVDPLDGTVNFLFGIPQWCVSVAVEDRAGTVVGAIYDPMREETFTAIRGDAPLLNDVPLQRSQCHQLDTAMVATGFSYDARVRAAQGEVIARVLPRVRDIRRFGSAALDLAWTAAGRYDAYFERTVKPWDIAAGVLLCRCAGLEVVDLPEIPELPYGILAATPELVAPLVDLVG